MSASINPEWLASFGSECWYCGQTLTAETATVDHRTPRCRGGRSSGANLVPACKRCNCSKKHRTEAEFFSYKPLFAQRRRFAAVAVNSTYRGTFNHTTAIIHRRTHVICSCQGSGVRPSWFTPGKTVACSCRNRRQRTRNQGSPSLFAKAWAEGLPQISPGMLGRTAYLIGEASFRKAAQQTLLVLGKRRQAAYLNSLQIAPKRRLYDELERRKLLKLA